MTTTAQHVIIYEMERDNFEEKLHETLDTVWDISLFDYSLKFIASFLVSVVVLFVLGIEIYFAFAPAAVFVAASYLQKRSIFRPIRTVEKGNPALRERLSAAYDNRERDNLVVRGLIREVSYDLNNVSTEKFINVKRTNTYVAISILAVFLLLFLLLSDFEGVGLSGLLGFGGGGNGGEEGEGEGTGGGGGGVTEESGETDATQKVSAGLGTPQNIYGDKSIAKIEGKELELEIHPEYGEGGDFSNDEEDALAEVDEIRSGYAQATAAESYTENIPVEMEGIVRRYFEKLTGE